MLKEDGKPDSHGTWRPASNVGEVATDCPNVEDPDGVVLPEPSVTRIDLQEPRLPQERGDSGAE